MIALIVVVSSIVAYLFIGGLVGNGFYGSRRRRCEDCQRMVKAAKRGECVGYFDSCRSEHDMTAAFFGALWPFTTPMLFGVLTANYFNNREDREVRKANRRTAEHERTMAEIEAQRKLADEQRIATMESVKFLVENGIKADVPGLYEVEETS